MTSADRADPPDAGVARWFAEEVQPHEPALRAYLQARFPSIGDHDDLVQETYIRLLRARQSGRLTFVKAFLFTAARNSAIDIFRRRKIVVFEPLTDAVESLALDEKNNICFTVERKHQLHLLMKAIDSLPERCRQVIMLRYIDGLAYKQIASHLGISPETVKVHMVRGVRACTAFFEKHGSEERVTQTGEVLR
jgi:RNA polymerase sigma factor (sigma-70 family)